MNINDRIIELIVQANGLKIASIPQEGIQAYIGSREIIKELKHIEELNRPGVYLLVNALSIKDSIKDLYIGKSDNIAKRFITHSYKKDGWEYFIVFTGSELETTLTEYLEKKLYETAKQNITTIRLLNIQHPQKNANLSKSQTIKGEKFFEKMLFILNNLGLLDILIDSKPENKPVKSDEIFYINLKKENKDKQAKLIKAEKGYMLLKDSYVEKQIVKSFENTHINKIRNTLIEKGLLKDIGNLYITIEDIPFKTPSGAASVVKGCNSNGRVDWKIKDGVSMQDLQ